MKKLYVPFKLGMEYENWEFDLECLPDRIEGYDSYIYLGTVLNKFLNKCTDETELLFNLDILEAVIITFKDKNLQFYKNINTLVASITGKLKHNLCIEEFAKFDVQIFCIYRNRNVFFIYSKNSITKELVHSIK